MNAVYIFVLIPLSLLFIYIFVNILFYRSEYYSVKKLTYVQFGDSLNSIRISGVLVKNNKSPNLLKGVFIHGLKALPSFRRNIMGFTHFRKYY